MHGQFETYMIVGSALLLFSVLASKITGRFGVPALMIFLSVGMLAGSEGMGGIHFNDARYAQGFGVIALIFILFSGGLNTEFKHIRPVLGRGSMLATFGIIATTFLVGAFVVYAFQFTWLEGLLLGAIVSSTDATAVFTILRGRNVHLKGNVKPLLEFESGVNDPMAVILTVGLLQLITQKVDSAGALIPGFLLQISVGLAIGWLAGNAAAYVVNRTKLEFEGLYPVLTFALTLLTYGLSEVLSGNGFLAVYLAGLVLGNTNFIHKKSLVLFHDGISWLMQIAMFLALGLLVYPSKLLPVAGQGVVISLFLIFVARPIAVFLSLIGSKMSWGEKSMISWVGLRGSVPIILATYPHAMGYARSDEIFHLVFFIVLLSILVQGSSIALMARMLKVGAANVREKFRFPLEYVANANMKSDLVEIEVPKNSGAVGKTILELGLPKDLLVVLIQRQGRVVVPKGGTFIELNDTLLVLSEKENLEALHQILAVTKTA